MDYQSTRNPQLRASSVEAVLAGIAPDGGLYIAKGLENLGFDWRSCLKKDAFSMAATLLSR